MARAASADDPATAWPPRRMREHGADPEHGLEDDEEDGDRAPPCRSRYRAASSTSARSSALRRPGGRRRRRRSKRRPSIESGRSTPARSRIVGRDVDQGDEPGPTGARPTAAGRARRPGAAGRPR